MVVRYVEVGWCRGRCYRSCGICAEGFGRRTAGMALLDLEGEKNECTNE